MIKKTNKHDLKMDDVVLELTRFLEKHDLVYPKIRKKNKVKVEGNVAYVYPNGESHKGKYFVIDLKYLPIIERFVWFYKDEYAVATIKQRNISKTIRMHRLIMGVLNYSEIDIDHINGDKNDNRECNLRVCCKGKDADNQANVNFHFEFPEIVDIFQLSSEGIFIMEVSNGLYDKVQIPYYSFKELIKDRQFLYENGMDIGLPSILENKYQELLCRSEVLGVDSKSYIVLKHLMYQFFVKFDEAKKRAETNEVSSILIATGINVKDIELDRPYFVNGTVVVIPSGKSSKEKYKTKAYMRFESSLERELPFQDIEEMVCVNSLKNQNQDC